jgi:undecaprenyl-diphosphatase
MDDAPQPAPAQRPDPTGAAATGTRHPLSVWDARASDWIGVRWPHPRWLSKPLGWISVTGNYGVVWYVVALAAAWAAGGGAWLVGRRFAYAGGAVLACQGVTFFVKLLVGRRRPVERDPSGGEHIRRPRSPSFPSSHASMSATGVVTLTTLYPSWLWAFIALGVVLAFSRVYLRVHYVLDVLAGLLLGTVFGFVVVLLVPPP